MKLFTFLLVFAFSVFIFYVFTHKKPVKNYQKNDLEPKAMEVSKVDAQEAFKQRLPVIKDTIPLVKIIIKELVADSLVTYAESLIGTPYKYASTDPSVGFDCSGFITYVFNHYNINVPRSSKDFVNTGIEMPIENSKRGDLILFTGTDSTEKVIGHMGIIVSNDNNGLEFIHSTSGKAYGVVITTFNKYYQGRFVKIIRVFN